jgi:hypothetical protein
MGSRAALCRTRLRPRRLRSEDLGEDAVVLVGSVGRRRQKDGKSRRALSDQAEAPTTTLGGSRRGRRRARQQASGAAEPGPQSKPRFPRTQGRSRRASPASPPQGWSRRRGAPRTHIHRGPSGDRQEPDDHAHAPPDPTVLSVELRGAPAAHAGISTGRSANLAAWSSARWWSRLS